MNIEKIYNDFVGRGKVQSISLVKSDNHWIYTYKEGRKHESIKDKNFDQLQKLHLAFGGRNPETCRAKDLFLKLDGQWGSDDLLELGHRPQKVTLNGTNEIRNKIFPISIPNDCGFKPICKKNSKSDFIKISLIDKETSKITRIFKEPEQLDAFADFILNDPSLQQLSWNIHVLGTETKATGDQCVWVRELAGDGTKRMVLKLQKVNGIIYTKLMRKQLHDAADDMFCSPCSQLSVKKIDPKTINICAFAAEDGTIDLSGYEAN